MKPSLSSVPVSVLCCLLLEGNALIVTTPPSNDDCAQPINISGNGQFSFDNTAATTGSQGQANTACDFFGTMGIANDLWYTWTALETGTATLSLCGGTTMDSKVAVYSGAGCPAGGPIACDDDTCSHQSQVCFAVTTGSQYTIQLGNYPGAAPGSGTFTITVSPPVGPCAPLDDGSSEIGIGLTAGGDTMWLQRFGAANSNTTVTQISTAWGSILNQPAQNPANGSPVDILVYAEPSQTGNPTDGVVLRHLTGTLAGTGTDAFQTFTLSPPVIVNGIFFVGAAVNAPVGQYPGPLDQPITCAASGAAWIVGNATGPLNFSALGMNSVPPLNMTSAGLPGQWLLRVTCGGSGHAGIDLCVPGMVGVIPCPCGNPQVPANSTRGCNNSANTGGALLTSSGMASLTSDTLSFTSAGEKPTASSILLQGQVPPSGLGMQFGQGVRCITAALKRLYVHSAVSGSVTFPQGADPSVHNQSAAKGDIILVGSSRLYAVYYRDPVVLGGCPAADTFNITQTQLVSWGP